MATVLSSSTQAHERRSVSIDWRALLRPWESTFGCSLVLTLWCLGLFFYGLSAGELVRTEGLRAMVAREMLHSGNWIVPTLFGEPLFTKPPGMYLAIALCSWPLGDVTPWSARLPSAIAASITVWMFFLFFRRHLGRRAGLLAALILPGSALWLDKVPAAEIDMVHVAWVCASILCFLRAVEKDSGRWWYAAALAMAAGFLTKWTAPVFLYATALPFLWWRGRLRFLLGRHHLLGLGLATLLCLTWAAWAISLTSWQVFTDTVQREGLPRWVPNYDRPYRYGEALLHPVKLIMTTLPWSLLALGTLWPGFYRRLDERGKFLAAAFHAWTWPNILVWSYVGEHTPRHSFPLFPGIAGLAVLFYLYGLAGLPRLRRTLLIGSLALWIIAKIAVVEVVLPARAEERRAREKGEVLSRLLPADARLYVDQMRDETMLFYCGRPVIWVHSAAELLSEEGPCYGLVSESDRPGDSARCRVCGRVNNERGDAMLLIRRK